MVSSLFVRDFILIAVSQKDTYKIQIPASAILKPPPKKTPTKSPSPKKTPKKIQIPASAILKFFFELRFWIEILESGWTSFTKFF